MVAIFSAPKHSANAEKANKRRMTANAFDRREQYLSEQNVSLLPPKMRVRQTREKAMNNQIGKNGMVGDERLENSRLSSGRVLSIWLQKRLSI
ncbi:hypothetical protein QA644_27930 (plasmid) [Rhizobium sp. CC1099]|uniref:hypothetical protein n=1 Tax=Rhizobium sp. CC1099 TaxID=3039160 RepID=UPI0024B15F04|nr:hypothetical protein [Rhizobium sp. CC1099]WFU89878.1 hypothetical protein QA644_27930 [Rhizobium sp. CC1099]